MIKKSAKIIWPELNIRAIKNNPCEVTMIKERSRGTFLVNYLDII